MCLWIFSQEAIRRQLNPLPTRPQWTVMTWSVLLPWCESLWDSGAMRFAGSSEIGFCSMKVCPSSSWLSSLQSVTYSLGFSLSEDRIWFANTLEEVVVKNFCTGRGEMAEMMSPIREVHFIDFESLCLVETREFVNFLLLASISNDPTLCISQINRKPAAPYQSRMALPLWTPLLMLSSKQQPKQILKISPLQEALWNPLQSEWQRKRFQLLRHQNQTSLWRRALRVPDPVNTSTHSNPQKCLTP